MRKFRRRLSALIIAVVVAITSFVQPVFAVAVVDDAAIAYLVYALAGGAGIYTLGSNEEIQKVYKQYIAQSDLKDYYSGLVSGGTLELYEVGSRIGVKLGSEVIDRLGDIYTDLYNYFSADKDSVIAPDGAVYDYTGNYQLFTRYYPIPDVKDTVVARIVFDDGCVYTSNYIKRSYGGYIEFSITSTSGNVSNVSQTYTSRGFALSVQYSSSGDLYYLSGNCFYSKNMCQHYNKVYPTEVSHVSSIYYLGDTFIFNNTGVVDIPSVPLTHDTPIPADVWRGGFEDGLQNADEQPMVWFPTGGKVYDNYNDVYDPDTGLISNVDIPDYVDRNKGYVADDVPSVDVPDVTNPDITVPDVEVPDIPDVGSGDLTDVLSRLGAIGGILNGILNLLRGLFDALAALPALIAKAIIGTGTLDFNKFPKINLTTVFPFCIPFDLVNSFKAFDFAPVEPKFVVDFGGTALSAFGTFEIDLTQFDDMFLIVRYFVYAGFVVSLIVITRQLVKG